MAAQWGVAPAKVDAREGGEYSNWDGDIHGIFTKLAPNGLIEQDWYGHDNPTWKYKVTFTFEGDDNVTTVHMVYTGDILDKQKVIADLRDYYFDQLRNYLSSK